MAILMLLTFTFLSILIQRINAELYPQYNNIVDINKYVHNINPVKNDQLYNMYQFRNNFAESRAGYNFGNHYGGLGNNIPLYTEKKVTTIRKAPMRKQPPKFQKSVPPFKPAQLGGGGGKWIKPNPGYGKGWKNQPSINVGKGHFNNFDIANTVNSFNKQIEQINKAAFEENFKERIPRFNEHSFTQNKAPFDYLPVNLDSKLNYSPFNFNTDLKINSNEVQTPSISTGHKTNVLSTNWNQNSAPINAEPMKFATFVPGIDALDGSGKILAQNSPNFESFLSQGKGGDPASFVQVTNGKVTYTYRIRHLPNNKH